MLGESASPFIDEGDGHTSERERVHMLLSLVAHAGGYRMMLGAHNTVVGAYHHPIPAAHGQQDLEAYVLSPSHL